MSFFKYNMSRNFQQGVTHSPSRFERTNYLYWKLVILMWTTLLRLHLTINVKTSSRETTLFFAPLIKFHVPACWLLAPLLCYTKMCHRLLFFNFYTNSIIRWPIFDARCSLFGNLVWICRTINFVYKIWPVVWKVLFYVPDCKWFMNWKNTWSTYWLLTPHLIWLKNVFYCCFWIFIRTLSFSDLHSTPGARCLVTWPGLQHNRLSDYL